jgi:hypothetical protein
MCAHELFIANVHSLGPPQSTAPTDINVARLGIQALEGGNFIPVHHDFLSFFCTNCGHTDLVHINQFNAWLQEKHGRSDV